MSAQPLASAQLMPEADKYNFSFNGGFFSTQVDCSLSSATLSSLPSDASATERLRYIYTWLRGKELTPIQAAAVVGNIAVESGGNPLASQNPKRDVSDPMTIPTAEQAKAAAENNGAVGVGHAWGIIQWDHGARAIYYQKKANISGSIGDMNTQLMLVLWHMKNESPTSKNNMFESFTQKTVKEAVAYFEHTMEGARHPALGKREAAAKIALQEYEGTSTLAYTSTSDTQDTSTNASLLAASDLEQSGCSPSGVISPGTGEGFIAKVTAYTWPYEWRSGPSPDGAAAKPTTLTSEYKKAIDQAKATNLYVGANGVDCGGYVTRLVRDSGLDPTYNNIKNGNIEGGPTATQSRYLQTSGKWRKIESGQPSSYYRPGDVAMQDGHTLIFVGDIASFWSVDTRTNRPIPPSELTKVPKANQRRVLLASASLSKRAPMADKDERVGSSAYTWYRYTGGTSL